MRPTVLLFMLVVIGSVANMDRAMTSLILDPIKHEFNLSDTWLGLVSGGPFAVLYSISSIPIARIADRGHPKQVLLICFAIWAAMIFCCGLAPSTLWLLAARMGVGVGEAGIIPTSHSMIPDAFPPNRRASAFAIYSLSTILGTPIALSVGGWMIQAFGWRSIFVYSALISVPVGIASYFFFSREPTQLIFRDVGSAATSPRLRDLSASTQGAFIPIVVGGIAYSFFCYGPIAFIPLFLLRYTDAGIAVIGWSFGLVTSVAGIVGALGGAMVAYRLTARNAKWLIYMPAFGLAAALPVAMATFLVHGFTSIILLSGLLFAITYAAVPPLYAAIQQIAGPRHRATAIAVYFATVNLLGMTIGPLVTGFLSDVFAASWGGESLRLAMLTTSLALLPAAVALVIAARRASKEWSGPLKYEAC
jgi:MFS family permease